MASERLAVSLPTAKRSAAYCAHNRLRFHVVPIIVPRFSIGACNTFYTVRYTRLPELLDKLTVFKDEDWLKQRKKYIKCDLLIINDWLLEKVKPGEAREIMEVIKARDRTGSLILCSQFAPSAWHAKLGNGAIADAVIDKVVYKSHVIHIEGEESMRKRLGGIN